MASARGTSPGTSTDARTTVDTNTNTNTTTTTTTTTTLASDPSSSSSFSSSSSTPQPPTTATTTTTVVTTTTTTTTTTASTTTTSLPPTHLTLRTMEVAVSVSDLQNDYTEGRIPSSPTRPRLQPEDRYPKVIVAAERPAFPDPRPRPPPGTSLEGDVHRVPPTPPSVVVGNVTVRVEEICLVLVVLMLWAGAISLFINRWGKLRMLEPYQPAYTAPAVAPPRPTPQPLGPSINIQSTSDLTLTDVGAGGASSGSRWDWGAPESYGRGSLAGGYLGMERSPSCLSVHMLNPQRKVKSAVDLVSLVMQEKMATSSGHLSATNV